MAEHGGYRKPSHPAAVSGPGALSARTDGGPTQAPQVAPGGPYGSRQDMLGIQSAAPLAGGGGAEVTPPLPAPRDLVPFGAPTQNPDEPVTAGAPAGAGIGPQAAGIDNDTTASLKQIATILPSLELMANLPTATPETRSFVRNLKARLASL